MKRKTYYLICLPVLMITILLCISSCKKDDSIVKKDVVITWGNPADIVVGTPLSATQLKAIASVPGNFVYTPAIGTVLNVGNAQNLKVDFTPTEIDNYNPSSKTVTINVINTFTDSRDGNVYKIVSIGNKIWMAENLRATNYRNGDIISNVTDNAAWVGLSTGAYCWFNNDITNKVTYGALYNWFTVSDSRNIAPEGWHIPSNLEWFELISFLGGESVAGGKLKETGNIHWISPNTDASNLVGFTALPSGYRNNMGVYCDLGKYGVWWTATEFNTDNAGSKLVINYTSSIISDSYDKRFGFSVRCVKD